MSDRIDPTISAKIQQALHKKSPKLNNISLGLFLCITTKMLAPSLYNPYPSITTTYTNMDYYSYLNMLKNLQAINECYLHKIDL